MKILIRNALVVTMNAQGESSKKALSLSMATTSLCWTRRMDAIRPFDITIEGDRQSRCGYVNAHCHSRRISYAA